MKSKNFLFFMVMTFASSNLFAFDSCLDALMKDGEFAGTYSRLKEVYECKKTQNLYSGTIKASLRVGDNLPETDEALNITEAELGCFFLADGPWGSKQIQYGYILDLKRNHPYSKRYILKDATRSVDQIEVREKAIKIEMHDPEQITPTSYSYEYVNMDLEKKELFIRKTQSANFNWYILIHLPKIALLEKDILRVQMSCKKVK